MGLSVTACGGEFYGLGIIWAIKQPETKWLFKNNRSIGRDFNLLTKGGCLGATILFLATWLSGYPGQVGMEWDVRVGV